MSPSSTRDAALRLVGHLSCLRVPEPFQVEAPSLAAAAQTSPTRTWIFSLPSHPPVVAKTSWRYGAASRGVAIE